MYIYLFHSLALRCHVQCVLISSYGLGNKNTLRLLHTPGIIPHDTSRPKNLCKIPPLPGIHIGMAMSNVLRHMSHDALGESITMPGASATLGLVRAAPAPWTSQDVADGKDTQVMAILGYSGLSSAMFMRKIQEKMGT